MIKLKEFYDKNRQNLTAAFIAGAIVFFLFYWTYAFIDAKKNAYEKAAETAYERLEKTVALAARIKEAERSVNKMNGGLLSFVQKAGGDAGIGDKLVNIRPIPSAGNIEHVSLRIENLYYDEFINFISYMEIYDNLRIKSVSFSRRYDNPNMIDAVMEVIKS